MLVAIDLIVVVVVSVFVAVALLGLCVLAQRRFIE